MADAVTKIDLTEKKVKALTLAFESLKNLVNETGDMQLISVFMELDNQLKIIKNDIKPLKTELAGIGSDTQGLTKFNENLDKIIQNTDKFINKIRTLGSGAGITMPSSISSELDKLKEQQRIKAEELLKAQRFNSVMSHVQNQETLTGQRMPLQQQLAYYKQAITEYEQGSERYLAILNRQRQVEQQINAQSEKEQAQRTNNVKNMLNSVLSVINSAVNKIVSIIKTSISTVGKMVQTAINIIGMFKNSILRILSLLGNFGNRLGIINKNGNILAGTFTELKSKVQVLTTAFKKLYDNQFVKNGESLLSSIQTLNIVVGGDLTDSTIEWANELERGLGLSASGLIADLKELTGVMHGLGMSGVEANTASMNLVSMANSLSTLIGYDTATVVNKIQSGMKGMTQSIDDLGLSVREAQMNSFLKQLKAQGGEYANIGTSFANLNEQQRIYVRYAAIMSQFLSKYDAETYAKSLQSITGRLTVFKNSLRTLGSTIGNFALQIFDKIVKPLTYLVNVLNNKIKELASRFGIKLELNSNMNDNAQSLNNTADAINNVTDAQKENEKTNNGLSDLDHISTYSSGSDSGIDNFDYSKLMDMQYDFAKALEEYSKTQNNYFDSTKEAFYQFLNNIKTKIKDFYKNTTGRELDLGFSEENKKRILENWETIKNNLKTIIDSIVRIVGRLGLSILEDIKIGEIITKLSNVFAQLSETVKTVIQTLEPYIYAFYNSAIRPIIQSIGEALGISLDNIEIKLKNVQAWFEDENNKGTIQGWFDNLYKVVEKVKDIISTLVILFKAILTGETPTEDLEKLNKLNPDNKWITGLYKGLAGVHNIVKDLIKDLVNFISNGGLEPLLAIVSEIGTFISKNKDSIVEILKKVAETAYVGIQAFLKGVLNVVQWVVDHKDLVINILDKVQEFFKFLGNNAVGVITALLGLKVGSWLGSILLKLPALITSFTTLFGLIKSGTTLLASSKLGTTAMGGLSAVTGGLSTATGGLAGAGVGAGSTMLTMGAVALPVIGGVGVAKGIKDIVADIQGTWGTAWDNMVSKVSLSGDRIKDHAVTMANGLHEEFGKEIPTSAIDTAVEQYKNKLEETGQYTKKQIDNYTKSYKYYLEQYSNNSMLLAVNTSNVLDSISKGIGNILKTIGDTFNSIRNKIGNGLSNLKTTISGWSINDMPKTKSIKGFANGGVPSKGSIFYANENGNLELAGNFGGYSGVANQDMIIESMKSAIGQGMYSAMTQALNNQSKRQTVTQSIEICKGGIFVGDNASIRKLANMINSVNMNTSNNISNLNFGV